MKFDQMLKEKEQVFDIITSIILSAPLTANAPFMFYWTFLCLSVYVEANSNSLTNYYLIVRSNLWMKTLDSLGSNEDAKKWLKEGL